MMEPAPLIVTLQIDKAAFTFFNYLRKRHFPKHLNYLDAHITLFHHLPALPVINQVLEESMAKTENITLEITGIMKLGRGVAYKINCPPLVSLHTYLQQQWQEWLTPQDRQKLNPHITVQNKVNVEEARTLYDDLATSFQPFTATGIGLSLWEYQGGPWQKVKDYAFNAASAD